MGCHFLLQGIFLTQWSITRSFKKNESMPFAATWMDVESVVLSEGSQTEREISYDMPYIWNLKRNDTNELTYKTETDSQT